MKKKGGGGGVGGGCGMNSTVNKNQSSFWIEIGQNSTEHDLVTTSRSIDNHQRVTGFFLKEVVVQSSYATPCLSLGFDRNLADDVSC